MFKHGKIFILISCVHSFVFSAAISQTIEPEPGPVLIFSETSYDFGTIREDTVVTHIFKFSNMGTDTLFIKRVTGSWGCTASLLSSEVIPPNGNGEIKVSFNPKNRTGKNRKTIYIFSNNTASRLNKLYIKAFIETNDNREPTKSISSP